jgi:arylsulfatase A
MKRRGYITATVQAALSILLVIALSGQTNGEAPSEEVKRPNIILIMAETLSARELGTYGNDDYETPNLDKLAATGVQFQTCWATPICIPSRGEIITGRYGFRTGWYHNMLRTPGGEPFDGQPLTERNMIVTEPLKNAGYATAFAAKWQLTGTPKSYGFDESLIWASKFRGADLEAYLAGGGESYTNEVSGTTGVTSGFWHPGLRLNGKYMPTADADFAPDLWTDFINDFARRQSAEGKPFFAYYAANLVHTGWDTHQQSKDYVTVPELDDNGNKTGRPGKSGYKANVEYLDHLVGRIVNNLEDLGIRDNTIIMFTADHGGDHVGKWFSVEERGSRVPMIVNCPGKVAVLGLRDELIDFSDVFPTICGFAGASIPDDYVIDGHSFAPLVLGEPYEERDWIFSYVAEQRQIRDKRWLLDGYGHIYDCGDNRDETGYVDVSESSDPEVIAAKNRFETILKDLPGPDINDPYVQECIARIERAKSKKTIYPKLQKEGKL